MVNKTPNKELMVNKTPSSVDIVGDGNLRNMINFFLSNTVEYLMMQNMPNNFEVPDSPIAQ